MEAEALALLEGVQLCLEHGLHYVQVDLDSKALQLMMLGGCQIPWKLWQNCISCSKSYNWQAFHILSYILRG